MSGDSLGKRMLDDIAYEMVFGRGVGKFSEKALLPLFSMGMLSGNSLSDVKRIFWTPEGCLCIFDEVVL